MIKQTSNQMVTRYNHPTNALQRFALFFFLICMMSPEMPGQTLKAKTATIPFILDHNRMLVEAEFQRADGSWRKALLWVDTGNPNFFISYELAVDLGLKIDTTTSEQKFSPPHARMGGMPVDFCGVRFQVAPFEPWLFNTMHNDGNLPSTVLQKYHVIFDYPARKFTIAEPGALKPLGASSPVTISKYTGIIQMDAVIGGEKYSFAFDNGASFSFVPDDLVSRWHQLHPDWPTAAGATGYANIWGMWPGEGSFEMIRIPEFTWGGFEIRDGMVCGLPPVFRGKTGLREFYSRKTVRPVDGFLGPNVFKNYRIEIVYNDSMIYFEKGQEPETDDMNIVPLTLKPLNDGSYKVIGVLGPDQKPVIKGIEFGDILVGIGHLKTQGTTMGTVIGALRGKPGEYRKLILEHDGKRFTVKATVTRVL